MRRRISGFQRRWIGNNGTTPPCQPTNDISGKRSDFYIAPRLTSILPPPLPNMSLPIVPALSTAFTVLSFIVSRIQAQEASRGQLNVLSSSTEQLLTILNKEFRELRLVPAKCVKPLADLEALLRDIHRFAENEKESGFLKMLFQRDARVFKIEAFQRRIGMCINTFEISSLLNIQTMLAESKRARARDAETLHGYLNTLEKNSAKLLQKLEINQNNTVAMMVSIQKQLNHHNVDRAEQTFYTHTLEYLTSRSGQNVKVEDWMISSFEVDYGPEIGYLEPDGGGDKGFAKSCRDCTQSAITSNPIRFV
ncbi:hypothetical protein B0H11DRAFT_2020595 [Mycena galericulata]|nr:hypothetical protein B0H11DRAFT_2020595 [Mycena galericulata]